MKFFILFPLIFGASEAVASICGRVADPRHVHSLLTWRDAPETSPEVSHRHDLRLSLLTTTRVSDNATYPVVVRYFSSCGGGHEVETSTCLGSHLGAKEEVEFRVEVVVVECLASEEVEQVVSIGGREGEVASIRLQFLCQCLCEKDGDPGCPTTDGKGYRGRRDVQEERERRRQERRRERERNMSKSELDAWRRERNERRKEKRRKKMRGTQPSGDDVRAAPDGRNVTGPEWERCMHADDTQCMATPSSAVCSGRGTCVCGECQCHQREDPSEFVYREFCECTNFLCNRFNGELCGGPYRGVCECDECECHPGWTGAACECQDEYYSCLNPLTREVCSGNGKCECNECKCFETEEGRYSGKWCDECPTCPSKCVWYRACVECQVFRQGELTEEECESQCTEFNATVVQSVAPEDPSERLCTFFDQNDCRFTFVYGTDAFGQRTVRVQSTLECPPPRTVAVAPTVCEDAQDECLNPETGEVCSGNGMCKCNQCKCYEKVEGRYSGKWCEDCPTCGTNKCLRYRACVECQVFRQGELTEEECETQCTQFNATVVQLVAPEGTETLCSFFDENDCRFKFVYGYDEDRELVVRVQSTLECPPPRSVVGAPTVCEDAQDECLNPETGIVCSDNGICECNHCKCYETEEGRHSGKWCEDCPTCGNKCLRYRACVECQVFRQGELTEEECETQCTEFNATVVQLVAPEGTERLCTFFDENDCRFKFVYGYDVDRELVVRVQSTFVCPPPRSAAGAPTGRKRDRKNRKKMREERKRGREREDQERESERAARRRERKERRKERKRNKMRGIEPSRDEVTTGSLTPDFFARCFDADESQCKATPSSAVCSGRGTCVCGECQCHLRENSLELVSGQFCECSNFLCDRFHGLLCGGPDRGECECDTCRCNPGWTGAACECQDSQDKCENPESGEVCSGNGMCECNKCKCYETEAGRYSGRWCEDCPICRSGCINYRACVECQVFRQGELTEEECVTQCTEFNATVVQLVAPEDSSDRLCTFFDQNDCRFKFVYGYDEDWELVVRVQSTLECPPPMRSWW